MSGALNRMPVSAFLGIVVAAVVGFGLLFVWNEDKYTVIAQFDDAAGVQENSEVTMHGVRVGTVTELDLDDSDRVFAKLEIDPEAAPVGPDARVTVKPKNLLGLKLVEIDPGDTSEPVPSGTVVGHQRTATAVDLDQVLGVLDSDTRLRLQVLVNEAGLGLAGRGADFNRLLKIFPSSLNETGDLIAAFAADNEALAQLLSESSSLLDSVARERGSLGELVGSATSALQATAARHDELGETIRQAPGALTQLRSTLADLEQTAEPLRPAARAIRRSADPLNDLLEELPGLRPIAVEALETAAAVSPDLSRLARGGRPLVRGLEPTTDQIDRFATSLDPLSLALDRGGNDILRAVEGWSRATQTRDGLSHVFRGSLVLEPDIAKSLISRFVDLPVKQKAKPAKAGKSAQARGSGGRRAGGAAKPAEGASGAPDAPDQAAREGLIGGLTERLPGLGPKDNDVSSLLGFLFER